MINERVKRYILYNKDEKKRISDNLYDYKEVEYITGFSRSVTSKFLEHAEKISGMVKYFERLGFNVTCRKDDKSRRRIN